MGTSHPDTSPQENELLLLEEQLSHAMPRVNPSADFRDGLRGRLAYAAQSKGSPVEIAAPRARHLKLLWGLAALSVAGATFIVSRSRTITKGEKTLG